MTTMGSRRASADIGRAISAARTRTRSGWTTEPRRVPSITPRRTPWCRSPPPPPTACDRRVPGPSGTRRLSGPDRAVGRQRPGAVAERSPPSAAQHGRANGVRLPL